MYISFKPVDVVIVGGGPAGLAAAIASAREGAHTVLVERYGFLGGMATAGLIGNFLTFHDMRGNQIVGGIAQEIIERLIALGGAFEGGHLKNAFGHAGSVTPYDAEVLKIVSLELLEEAGAKVLLHSFFVEALTERDIVRGIIVVNKSGEYMIPCKVVVDATGDGDVAKLVNKSSPDFFMQQLVI